MNAHVCDKTVIGLRNRRRSPLARQIKEHTGRWDMKAVRDRSQKLAKEAVQIWAWSNV